MSHGMVQSNDARALDRWKFLRVYYFDACKDALILDGIWPAISAAALAGAAFFQRDWEGGPNVLVGVAAEEQQKEFIGKSIQQYLGRRPSEVELTQEKFAEWAIHAGQSEARLENPALVLRPNNSIHDCPESYNPLLQHSPSLRAAVREFLCQSSPVVVSWLDRVRAQQASRHEIAIQALIALLWAGEPQGLRSHMSFGSHVEGFFYGNKLGLRDSFERHYNSVGESVRAVLRTTREDLDQERFTTPGLLEFAALLCTTFRDLVHGFESGAYHTAASTELVRESERYAASHSSFGALKTPPVSEKVLRLRDSSPVLQAWQILVNLGYLTLKQLGLAPLERFLACYLISRAVEAEIGESATSLMRRFMETGDPSLIISRGAYDRGPEQTHCRAGAMQ
jgi:hypothetical protein